MEQGLKSKIAVVGAGPAGCFCAYNLQNDYDVTVFDIKEPLLTLLPTGGGRCNLAHYEFDNKELAANYPRGEKFLYSVFSQFSTAQTLEFFNSIGVDTFVADDMRIFPVSNSSAEVRRKFLNALDNVKFIRAKIGCISSTENGFTITAEGIRHKFSKIVIAIGGHAGFNLIERTGHRIISAKPSLAGLVTREDFSSLSGVCLKNVPALFAKKALRGDVMFTHSGITGPLIYTISSLMAREDFPYIITLDFAGDLDLQQALNQNPHKSIKNLLAEFLPKSFSEFMLKKLRVNPDEKSHRIDGKTRDGILNSLKNFKITAVSTRPDGETVTCGGVDLKEVNPKTMESKVVSGMFFCGEVLDIDGFCGGFNLQNCWSTAYAAACGVRNA